MNKKDLQIGGRTLSLETGAVARQANGACVIRYGDTVVLATACFKEGTVIGDFMLRREDAWAQRELAEQGRATQAELGWVLDQVCAALDGLTAAQLTWRPATEASNSLAAVAGHVLGSTRVYALGFGCGREVERDRAAEFAVSGADAVTLVAAIRQLSREIAAARSFWRALMIYPTLWRAFAAAWLTSASRSALIRWDGSR